MKFYLKKNVLAGFMAVVVGGAGFVGMPGCGMEYEVQAKENENKLSTERLYKEESVYVKTDSSGNVTNTTVTEWLKNPKKGNLTDETTLNDVKNIKGEETFSKGANGQIQWESEGKDIYYQGTSKEKLPVGVRISYKLDGKHVSAKELSGKSGKLEMEIAYKNDARQLVKVGNKKEQMYIPFTMVTAMIFPTDEYKNVEIDHGKIISDGDKNIVVGFGFPGLEENLALSDKDFDVEIPDSVKVTADVENVSVGETFTVASCELMNDLDLDEMDSFDDLEDSIDELEDAAGKLVDGSGDAKDGADQLKDGAGQLKEGTKALKSGSEELANGAKSLSEGSGEVAGGIQKLNEKSGSLISGVNSLAEGVTKYTTGVLSLKEGSKSLYDGTVKVKRGILEADQSLNEELIPGAEQVKNGASSVKDSVEKMADDLKRASAQVESIANVEVSVTATATATATATIDDVTFKKSVSEIVNEVSLPDGLTDEQKTKIKNEIRNAISEAREISVTPVTETVTEKAKIGDNVNYKTAEKTVKEAAYKASEMEKKMSGFVTGTNDLCVGLNQLEQSLAVRGNAQNPTIGDGAESLATGSKALYEGASALVSQNDALNLGTTLLKEGGSQLQEGVKQLADGSDQVASGAKTLNGGVTTLKQGIGNLNQGAESLYEGTEQLADGLKELSEGMSEFKSEGIDEIADAFNGDFKRAKDRLIVMSDLSKEYKSYAGIQKDIEGSTKFIIETVGIDKDK